MEEKNKEDLSIVWKVLVAVLFGILIGIIFQAKYISAMEWPMNKTSTCNLFNISEGLGCEVYWCNTIRDGSYNLSTEVCQFVINNTQIVNQTINNTIYVNVTQNETNLPSENYYNKTEVEFLLNNKTGTLRDSIMDNYVTKSEVINLNHSIKTSSDGISDSTLILIIVIICVFGVMFFLQQKTREIPTASQRGEAKTEFRKLQSQKTTGELGVEHNLKLVMDKLDKLEKEKAKDKPKKKVIEEEPEEEEENQEEEE